MSLFVFMPMGGVARPQTPGSSEFQISVNVDLVALEATITDKKGHVVPELHEQNFQIYEDGVKQAIRVFRHEDAPVTAGLVIDHSGSMHSKLAHVIEGARTFVRSSNHEDQMFVINFNERVSLGLPRGLAFTDRPEVLDAAISRVPATGRTALYDAVVMALDKLQTGTRAKKVLIVISDGGDNASVLGLTAVMKKVMESNASIYTIGVFDDEDPDKNPAVLRRLARATGGEAFFPKQLDQLVAICDTIARDIRHQYTLGYVSSNAAKPGAYRAITVTAGLDGYSKLQVRTKAGYIK
jgi:Ca-activated chloride channel homolog